MQWGEALAAQKREDEATYGQALNQVQQQLQQATADLQRERAMRAQFNNDLRTAVFRGVSALNQETLRALQNRADIGLDLPPAPQMGTGYPGSVVGGMGMAPGDIGVY